MNNSFTSDDLKQIAALGISIEDVELQIQNFRTGFPKTHLISAATIENGGIKQIADKDINRYSKIYEKETHKKKVLKFVPASGAATRMFKDLYAFSATYFGVDNNFGNEYPSVKEFLEHIRSFAFFEDLQNCMKKSSLDFGDYMDRGDFTTVVNFLLKEHYLGYGVLPKALLKFHRYGSLSRTALEEHIVEGIDYAQSANDEVNIHFTVSPEHRLLFRKKVAEIKKYYESAFGIKLNISFSEQKHFTDTIAVNEQNIPIRDENQRLVFRPAGHGALIENLNECNADIIFIKNIDNVVPDWMKHTTIIYKKVLAGYLLSIQNKIFEYLRILDKGATETQMKGMIDFLRKDLLQEIPVLKGLSAKEKTQIIKNFLNRPIRICGMVKNQGEPGGGPFFTLDSNGKKSLQIVEASQINRKDPQQEAILQESTHFNPVDLVCATKNYKGRRFNLKQYIDPNTGFIAKKTKGAETIKSQELPGLWNGAMANWITLFVEVPLATFNPVKTINDLLRKEHLEN